MCVMVLRSQCSDDCISLEATYQAMTMRESVRLFHVMVFTIGLAACGYPPLPELGDIIDAPSSDAAPPPQFLSCTQLPATCGANGNDSCCDSLDVPAGSYNRSYDLAGDSVSGNTNSPAAVSRFRLDNTR